MYSISSDLIIRKENFGGIIFNPNTELTVKIDASGYSLLKNIINYGKIKPAKKYQVPESEMRNFILKMIKLGIISKYDLSIKFYNIKEKENTGFNVLSFPESLHLTITYNCNLNCIPCYYADVSDKENMSLETYKQIIEEAKDHGLFQIAIGGGEPFFHPQIWEFLEISSNAQVTTNITTNGTLLGKQELVKLENFNNIGWIQLSLDGSNEEIHSGSRSHFEKVIECLKYLSNTNLKYGINFLLRNSNVNDLPNMISLCQRFNACSLHLLRIKPPILNDKWFQKEKLKKESLKKLISFLQNYKKIKKPELYIDASMSYLFQNGMIENLKYTGCSGCSGGISFLTILPNGDILPCTHLRIKLGNIDDGIKKVWTKSQELHKLRNKELWLDEPCRSCHILKSCFGCRALSMKEQNNIAAYDRECSLIRDLE